jgi:glycosyltransferase involved in cell wall biosynthesis
VRDQTQWNLCVVFVGSEKGNREYLQRYATRLGLGDAVRFLEYVTQGQLVQLYRRAFCLAFATFCGPDNLPPLEAFALGCPVVASDVPGASEQLGDAALLFPPADHAVLAQRIVELKSDSLLRQRLIEAGLRRAARHSWTDYVCGLVAALDEFGRIRRAWSI